MVSGAKRSLEPRLSIPNFVSQFWRKIKGWVRGYVKCINVTDMFDHDLNLLYSDMFDHDLNLLYS